MSKTIITRAVSIALIFMIIIPIGMALIDPFQWNSDIYMYFAGSLCVGIPLAIIVRLYFTRLKQLSPMRKIGGLVVFCAVFASAGFATGRMMHDAHFSPLHALYLLTFNFVLSGIVGGFAFIYFSVKDKTNRMAVTLKEKEVQEAKLLQLKTRAELESLQTKVNPHFLFNTLNSIASLISENPKAAEATVEKLAELFRYTLQSTEQRTVKLTEELEIVRLYLQIEQVRFGERLQFEIIHDERLSDIAIPALLIQPLAENAIKHAVGPSEHGGTIIIITKLINGACLITVADSGTGFATNSRDTGFGLKSIRERLLLLYGTTAHLDVVNNGSTQVRMTIPFS